METLIDFLHARQESAEQFERDYPHPFLVMEASIDALEKKSFSFQTQLASEPLDADQLQRILELRKQGKRLTGDVARFVYRLQKRPGSAFASRISFGRTSQCDLVLPDGRISKLHAYWEHSPESGRYVLVECGSRNGTKVDGRALGTDEKAETRPGSLVEFGPFRFRFLSARQLHALLQTQVEQTKAQQESIS